MSLNNFLFCLLSTVFFILFYKSHKNKSFLEFIEYYLVTLILLFYILSRSFNLGE